MPLTNGESLSPIMAAFLTVPLNPFVYSVLILVGDQARRYEQVQMNSTATIRKASKLNKADYIACVEANEQRLRWARIDSCQSVDELTMFNRFCVVLENYNYCLKLF